MSEGTSQKSFFQRFWIYQKERFPFVANGVLIAALTFSAVGYSRVCRNVGGFVSWKDYAIGVFATFTLFLLVRIFDEFKDQEEDKKYRSYLPVPRGLISLNELKRLGIGIAVIQIAVIAIFQPTMLWLYLIVIGYLCLMGVEFFIPEFLRKRQMLYITSHMFIIPLVDIYASGLDWKLDGDSPHLGLLFFFLVSYFNGIVLEFGRKIRSPENEEEGVITYTKLYGLNKGVYGWMALVILTAVLAIIASYHANFGIQGLLVFSIAGVLCMIPAFIFLKSPSKKWSKIIEYASGLWTLILYLTLGGIPMLMKMVS